MALAYIELGIWPKEFWRLSLYEWSLCVARVNKIRDDKKREENLLIVLEGNTMALHANLHRDPNTTPAYDGRFFYPMSYDDIVEETKKVTGKEMMDFLTERFKNKPIKKRG